MKFSIIMPVYDARRYLRVAIESVLGQFDVISFDVFDTLLLRPYLKPTPCARVINVIQYAA